MSKRINNSNTIINDIQKKNRLLNDELSKIVAENRLIIENDVNSVEKKLKDLDQLSSKNRQSLIEIERTLASEFHQSRQFSNKAEPQTLKNITPQVLYILLTIQGTRKTKK